MNKRDHFIMYKEYENVARDLREKMKKIQKQLEKMEDKADYHFNQWYQKAKIKE